MEVLSREYGWTPKEIAEQDYQILQAYWQIIAVRAKLEEEAHKRKR